MSPADMTPDALRQARLRLGLTQGQMAVRLGLDGRHAHVTISRMERGVVRIDPRTAVQVRDILDIAALRAQLCG
jgi:transcriptional regulator with XRE-family HTH domain